MTGEEVALVAFDEHDDRPLVIETFSDLDADDFQAIEEAAPEPEKGNGKDRTGFPLSETGNAELFTSLYGEILRFDHLKKRQLTFGPHKWKEDRDGKWMRLPEILE